MALPCLYTLTIFTLILTKGVTGECGNNHWQCHDGTCIRGSWRCDGVGDCLDRSDELECVCSQEDFECADASMCITKSAVCDGRPQCADGSDELNCNPSSGCLLGEWTCRNKICIPQDLRCNGINDCGDSSDEEGCGPCGDLNVRCPNGTCLTLGERCDGVAQCSDGRDEPVTCARMCRDKNGGCSHICTDQLWGAQCSCPVGLKLSAKGAKCEDINECTQAYGPCMHICINTKGSFRCQCHPGFKPQSGNVCQAQGNVTKLLTIRKGLIGLVSVKARTYKTLFTVETDPVALAFDFARNLFYWADGNGNIYKAETQTSRVIFSGQSGIKSLAVDWISGQLYWTNLKLKRINAGLSDGSAIGVVMSKDTEPADLVLLPGESTMFWINKGPNDVMTIERAGMDGSMQSTLVVVTAQLPKSLTVDVAVRRLYWISDFRMSIETVKVDGTGRYTFLEFFKGRTAQNLAVFNGWFYWADEKRLWEAPQNQPNQKNFILKATTSFLTTYHELQQPRGFSPCKKSCQLCLPSLASPGGPTCLCSKEMLSLPPGTCDSFRLAYASSTNVYTLEYTPEGPVKALLFSSEEDVQSFDIDWKRGWVIWTNDTGHVKARPLLLDHSKYIPVMIPVCFVKVDQKTGNLYWVSCDQLCIGVTHVSLPDQSFSKQLYLASGEIDELFVDWQRGQLYWLEDGQIVQMRLGLMGGNAKAIYSFEKKGVRQIALDRKANSFLWNSQNELQILSLLKMRQYSAGKEWAISGDIVAAYEPYMVTMLNDVITVWKRQDWTQVAIVALESGVVGITVAVREVRQDESPRESSPTGMPCKRPSLWCKPTSICLSQDQLCDRKKDCPDGSDEVDCPSFLTKDSKPPPLRCRLGFKSCKDGSECVLISHVCDGEVDCKDGSDEEGCERECRKDQFHCAHGRMCIDKKLVCDGTPQCQDRSDEMGCFTQTQSCSHHCDNKTRCVPEDFVCDGERDCVDGTDESNCSPPTAAPSTKPTTEMSCKSPSVLCDGTSVCVNQTQLCDGKLDCPDGFDELFCLHACLDPGHFLCKNRRKCIEQALVCDGRPDCLDGSDELQCPACPLHCDEGTICLTSQQFCDGKPDCRDGSDERNCYVSGQKAPGTSPLKCPLGSKPCKDGKDCVLYSHVCDGEKDCKDGSDEKNCERKCKKDQFQCAHGRMCIDNKLVCDGTPHCQDRSDEINCFQLSEGCHHHCDNKTRCIPQDFVCDGEKDCADGSDEADCPMENGLVANNTPIKGVSTALSAQSSSCRSPLVVCVGSLLCISKAQLCDGKMDCPDGSDEASCIKSCGKTGDFLCKDRRTCVKGSQVCDGQPDCSDGSDEVSCPTVAAKTTNAAPIKCRLGSKPCKDGSDCVLISHVCDGEIDCKDGSDEKGCDLYCNPGQFQCVRGRRCIDRKQVCDGTRHCQDGSDEANCWKPTRTCSLRCDQNTRCIPEVFICNGMRDCWDGSDETDCGNAEPHPLCKSPSIPCLASSQCISQKQLCDGRKDCADGSDERPCISSCPYDGDFLCKDRRRCVDRNLVCDTRFHCTDGSDETDCPTVATTTTIAVPLKCRLGLTPCKDGSDCILYSHVCDGENDCKDGSDEDNCDVYCRSGQFQCAHGKKCIDAKLVCDGKPQCQDRSDEMDCFTRTKSCSHRCDNKTRCIPEGFLCDGERDCVDGTDEADCGYPTQVRTCASPSVLCRGGTVCISGSQVCDGKRDCPDGFDEESCIKRCPRRGDFLCKDKKRCIKKYQVCDGLPNCTDGSDEVGCPTVAAKTTSPASLKCRLGFKPCKDGSECILSSHVCDGEVDCKDGSDEEGCERECRPDQFRCAHGRMCIDKKLVCDGTPQCQDRSDELGCFTRTQSCSHHCDNKTRCIPQDFLCDGEKDCVDGTDEAGCPPATLTPSSKPTTEMSCKSPSVLCDGTSVCVNQSQLCDGKLDCPDGFDELFCLHACLDPGHFLCKNRRKCIEQALVCDGRPDCLDGSDESQCPACPLHCDEGTVCLTSQQFCDGKPDCRDGSDERNCYKTNQKTAEALKCPLGSRPCRNGKECVLNSHVCDGEKDCKDGSDEKDCERQCKKRQFQCAHGRMCIDMKMVCDGIPQCQDRSDEINCFKLAEGCSHHCDNRSRCIPDTFLCDGERDCLDGTDELGCAKEPCFSEQFQCASRQCVSISLRCDGHADCHDHSDEKNCRKPPRCPLMERCPNSHECLLKEWLCDGDADCSDGSDEQNCKTPLLQCEEYQWLCASKNQCIPSSWRCDSTQDCKDQSDEVGCAQVKCPTHMFQCESKECVHRGLVCDGVSHCLDGSDEGPGCLRNGCSGLRRPACEHYCFSTPDGARCGCQEGFELLADGVSCGDIDECNEISSVCSHECVNTHGSYVCQCYLGYRLEPDNSSCKTREEPRLLASVQYKLLLKGLWSCSLQVLLPPGQNPIFSLDFDYTEQRLFWVSLQEESIKYAVHGDKDSIKSLIKGVKSDSIAVDWIGRNLYWVDGAAGQILAVRLSSTLVKPQNYIVILDEDLEQPRSLVLLPQKGVMLWSEIGSEPQIERAGMDGSDRKVVISHSLSWPVAVTVDILTDRIYWADEKLKCIGSATLDGQDIRLLQLMETASPFSVAVFNNMVYWSDTQRQAIHEAHKITGKNHKVVLKRPGQPFGLKVVHPLMQPKVSNPCEKLGCSHICLLGPGSKAVCRCPAGLLLAEDGITCGSPEDSSSSFLLLLSPTTLTQIFMRTLRGNVGLKHWPDHRALALPSINKATGLDLILRDSTVYLADGSQASVTVNKMVESGLTNMGLPLQFPGDTVSAMAVDWITRNLYWSSSKQPQLYVTSDGWKYTTMVLQAQLLDTTSIALHPPTGRLCFMAVALGGDEPLTQVDCAFMDGRNRRMLWKKAQMPMYLAFSGHGSTLYWVDIAAEVIASVEVDGSNYREYKTGPPLIVSFAQIENIFFWVTLYNGTTRVWYSDGIQPKQMWFEVQTNVVALKAYSRNSQKGTNLCAENNGGCSHLCLAYPSGRTCRCTQGYITVNGTQCVPSQQCPEGTKPCRDGHSCLSSTKFCDKVPDCHDGSDEEDCTYMKTKPETWPSTLGAADVAGSAQNEVLVRTLGGKPCDSGLCNGRGRCVIRKKEPVCECSHGYSGPFCQDGGSSSTPIVLAVLFIFGLVVMAAVLLKRRREKAARGRSTDKETLMKDLEEPEPHPQNFVNELYNPEQEEEEEQSTSVN